MCQIEVVVSGRVQGVGFRDAVRRKALELAITGWVANCADGSVQCVAQGKKVKIEIFLAFLNQGPRLAMVDRVAVEEQQLGDEFRDFVVRQ